MILVLFQELANESSVPMNYYQVYGQVGKFLWIIVMLPQVINIDSVKVSFA